MRTRTTTLIAILCAVISGGVGCSRQTEGESGDFVYKIETGGVLSGYAIVDTQLVVEDGEELIRLDQRNHIESSLMGAEVTSDTRLGYLLEPVGKRVRHHDGESITGKQTMTWTVDVAGTRARSSSSLKRDGMVLDLPPDTIVENTVFFDHIVADFARSDIEEKTYPILDLIDFQVRDTRYRRCAGDRIELAGAAHDVVVVDRYVEATGAAMRLWIDTSTAMAVKILQQDGHVISLATPSVVDRVERVSMDGYILTKTDVAIADVTGITYLKVRARLRPLGMHVTMATLSVPGQSFTGTVAENLIDGVFEIEHPRYDGTGAPAFPVADPDPSLAEFLAADGVYEAADEVLVDKAQEITAGSADAWDAATRLARWVAEEVGYAIPGGGTARRTYDMRAGECGGHAILLATFCRAVGIPARMVVGCMYTPNQGGSFGQHGWTEVHMGASGWIPIDATAGETDFVDSGHIRLAHFESLMFQLNARNFEILEYRTAGGDDGSAAAVQARFAPYLGKYREVQSSRDCEVKVMDGHLVLDLPNQILLALDDPDENGHWVCTVARHVYTVFDGPETGDETQDIEAFTIHEVYSLPRQAGLETVADDVPAELAPYLGRYRLAALSADFEVGWDRSGLALKHPRLARTFALEPADEIGAWSTPDGPYTIAFVTGTDGRVVSLTLDAASVFRRR